MNKHLVLAAVLSLATASPALAQYDGGFPSDPTAVPQHGMRGMHRRGPHGGHGHHGRRMDPAQRLERMTQELGLTPAQVQQIQRIHANARAQREALRGQGRSPEARQAREALRQQTRAQIEAVLTPAQRQLAAQRRDQRAAERLERRMQHMTERLALRPDQAQRIRGIVQQAQQQHRALGRGPEQREAHRALHERTMAQVDAVLDADQRARAQQLRQRMRHGRGRGGR
jgi:hypothetical protein